MRGRGWWIVGVVLLVVIAGIPYALGYALEQAYTQLAHQWRSPVLQVQLKEFKRGWWRSNVIVSVHGQGALAGLTPIQLNLQIHHGLFPLSSGVSDFWRPALYQAEGQLQLQSDLGSVIQNALMNANSTPIRAELRLDGVSEIRLDLPALNLQYLEQQLTFSGSTGLVKIGRQGQILDGRLRLDLLQWVGPEERMALRNLESRVDAHTHKLMLTLDELRLGDAEQELQTSAELHVRAYDAPLPVNAGAWPWLEWAKLDAAVGRVWLARWMRQRMMSELQENARKQGKTISESQLRQLSTERVEQQLEQYQAAGFLRREGDRYRAQLLLEAGNVLLNGKPLPIPLP